MDPVTLIVAALGTGVATGGQAVMSDALKDGYVALKQLIQQKFAGKAEAELALTKYEEQPQVWEVSMKAALIEVQADQDGAIIEAAQRVMALAHPQQAAMGKYNVQISGGTVQGENANVTQHFGIPPTT